MKYYKNLSFALVEDISSECQQFMRSRGSAYIAHLC